MIAIKAEQEDYCPGPGGHQCSVRASYPTTDLAAGTKLSLFRGQRNESRLIGGQWGMC
jgi:hypothetical protein